jgi:hypothetical protein
MSNMFSSHIIINFKTVIHARFTVYIYGWGYIAFRLKVTSNK